MFLLFRISTGESYNGVMHDCMVEEPACSGDGFYGVADGNFAVNDEEP